MKSLLLLLLSGGWLWSAPLPDGDSFGERLGFDLNGFLDVRAGSRLQSDPNEKSESLGEIRLQLDASRYIGPTTLQIRTDLLYDDVADSMHVDLEEGRGWLDPREFNLLFSPASFVDVKVGRQILTWGTGDLVFINDLFPKDWQSFFTGRDTEYLKAPSDALFASFFPSFANIDLAWTPRFDADRHITGERLSFWNGNFGRRTGRDAIVAVDRPDSWGSDGELALRLSRNIGSYELAFYGYRGFWKSPAGQDPQTGLATFPELDVYGASIRGQVGNAIVNGEIGYYDSQDSSGENPFVRNSEFRVLLGYQRELGRNLNGAFQYYLERRIDQDGYERGLPPGAPVAEENRHVVTARLTRLAMNQNLILSFFAYYSPSDEDGYLRPNISYKPSDSWMVAGGANLFFGEQDHTFFGQFEKNNNLYMAIRYSF